MNAVPSEVELVLEFLNTADLEGGSDELRDPAALRAWLGEHGLKVTGRRAPTAADLERALAVREALRALVAVNTGTSLPDASRATLEAAAARANLGVHFMPDGSTAAMPTATGIDGALGYILAAVHHAMGRGTWGRLKPCGRDRCRWAFYDTSKNHSRRWCSMEVCGNREKGVAFRRRQRSEPEK